MSKTIICSAGIALLSIVSGHSQEPVKPLSSSELLKTIDSIGVGDPLLKQPLSVGDGKPASKKDGEPSKKQKGPTEITARDMEMDNKTHMAIFIGDVVVKDPEFNVDCDKLTAFLKHTDKPAAKPDGAKADPTKPAPKVDPKAVPATPEPAAKGADDNKGGLEKAIAEATGDKRVLITQEKVEADGTISHNVGRGKKAVYDATAGNIVLTGMPSVQQGFNTCVALEESTVITLNRDGKMNVKGLHKSVLSNTSDKTKGR